MSKNVWRCRCGKRVEVLTDENFGDCGCSDPVYGPEYFYMSEECADMLDEMDKDYDKQHKQLAEARAEIERLKEWEYCMKTQAPYEAAGATWELRHKHDQAVIAERDKLIELMREALIVADSLVTSLIDTHVDRCASVYDFDRNIIKAALSAERVEYAG